MTSSPFLDPPPFPRPLDGPPARGRVLVVAPHPDDELIGPGGTVLAHRDLGDEVHVVVLTDGALGDADPGGDVERYRSRRERESRQAAERFGAASIEFLGFPDGTRAREEDLGVVVPRLREIMELRRPAVVYCPHPGENHPDHYVGAVATLRAAAASGLEVRCFGYEVWTALQAGCVVDVTAHMEEKLAIGRLFESQLEHSDILHLFGGLNAHRAVFLPKGARYGEAFVELVPREDFR